MTDRKRGTTHLLTLLVVTAFGAMAFAASAQAVAPGFLIGKKSIGALLATVGASGDGTSTILVPGLNSKLSCMNLTLDEGHLESKTDARLTFLYTGCTVLSISKLEEIPCWVDEPIKVETLLLPTETAFNGQPAILAEKIKALIILFKLGGLLSEPCILPYDTALTGEICFQIFFNDTVEPLIEANSTVQCKERQALEAAEGSGVKDVLKYGLQTATFDGSARLFLTGAHLGLTLGVSLY
jgi:hypothetical protein